MLRRIFMVLGIVAFVFGISKLSFAMEGSDMTKEGSMQPSTVQAESVNKQTTAQPSTSEPSEKAEEVGNKICPVTGEKIDEKTKATYEYKGKIYNFCCPMCIDEFKKNPEEYIKKIEQEKQK